MSAHPFRRSLHAAKFIFLAWLPMALGFVGALFDERRALGFTIWRDSCRAAGMNLDSVLTFTLELLPTGVAGVLSGGVVVLAGGLVAPERLARGALAAHAGCVLAMPVSVLICALSWPWSVAMLADAAITVPVTLLAWRLLSLPGSRARCRARQGVPSV